MLDGFPGPGHVHAVGQVRPPQPRVGHLLLQHLVCAEPHNPWDIIVLHGQLFTHSLICMCGPWNVIILHGQLFTQSLICMCGTSQSLGYHRPAWAIVHSFAHLYVQNLTIPRTSSSCTLILFTHSLICSLPPLTLRMCETSRSLGYHQPACAIIHSFIQLFPAQVFPLGSGTNKACHHLHVH